MYSLCIHSYCQVWTTKCIVDLARFMQQMYPGNMTELNKIMDIMTKK